MMNITCTKCGETKPETDFAQRETGTRRKRCRACRSAYQREYQARRYREEPEFRARMLSANRKNKFLREYGITPERAAELLEEQGGICAICREPIDGIPNVDHDHTTGAVRGILCGPCNRGLGTFGDNKQRLIAAARYIQAHIALGNTPALGEGS